jgi:antitoxin PrlF
MPIASAKVTSKGQITLPAKLRDQLGIKPGDRLDFKRHKDGKVELVARTERLEDLAGILRRDGPPLTDEEIVEMVHQARAEMGQRVLDQLERYRK